MMHLSLAALFIAFLLRVSDITALDNSIKGNSSQGVLQAERNYMETCGVSGGAQLMLEAFAYLNLLGYMVAINQVM